MEQLFTINVGLMVWTVLTFLLLVLVLAKFGWGPMIKAIREREEAMRAEREGAERARAEAQRIQSELEARLGGIDAKAKEVLSLAAKEAAELRERHKVEAQAEAKRLTDKARAELEDEKKRLVGDLRKEVASLSIMAAEKLVRRSVDDSVQKSVLESFFKDLDQQKTRH